MGIFDIFGNSSAWGLFTASSAGRLAGVSGDILRTGGYNVTGWGTTAASTAAISAGIDALNATMNASLALTSLASGTPLSVLNSQLLFQLQALNVASFAGNYSADVARIAYIYSQEGSSPKFEEAVGKFAFQNALAAVVWAGALAIPPLGATALTGAAAAGLAYVLGGLVYDFMSGEYDQLTRNFVPFSDYILGFRDGVREGLREVASAILQWIDPLTLDLDGDGIELSPLGTAGQTGASTVFFDFDGDGFRERTGWVKVDDGMLAIDLNGNGLIDNGGELFGQPARDGYEVLETYDTFADGVIDAKVATFARLRIWRDLDPDGVTDTGEQGHLAHLARGAGQVAGLCCA